MARPDDPFESPDEVSDESEDDELAEQDAVSLLSSDHAEVKQMFEEYRQLVQDSTDDDRRGELAGQICSALTVHAEIEEDVFYPALRERLEGDLALDQAEVEHGIARDLIEQIESMEPDDPLFDARVLVLAGTSSITCRKRRPRSSRRPRSRGSTSTSSAPSSPSASTS